MEILSILINKAERVNESDAVTNEDSSDNQLGSNLTTSYPPVVGSAAASGVGGSLNLMQTLKGSTQKDILDHVDTADHSHSTVSGVAMKDFKSKLAANAGNNYISAKRSGNVNKKTRYR